MSSSAISDDWPLTIRRVANARRMRLAVDPRSGAVRLTLPKRTPLPTALAWAAGHRAWIEAARAKLPAARPFAPGGIVPVEGEDVAIDWSPAHPRAIRLDGARLRIGGARESLPGRVERWLTALARERLSAATAHYAGAAGVTIGRIGIGDPASRWGSCTGRGDIRYSWRLVLAPPEVLRATAAHEVAHRLHMDHSPAFHAALADLYGRAPDAEWTWLKRHGAALHRVGRAD